jgi:isopenicillin N synthase-like dioxygenase
VFLDQEKLSNEEFSHSIMGLYHYYDHPTPIETCAIHEDMGLISFIPKSEVSGLQVFDFELWKWVHFLTGDFQKLLLKHRK